jgi:hypothetical protein
MQALPESLGEGAWDELDQMIAAGDYIEMLMPSHFGQSSERLEEFAQELGVDSRQIARRRDPLHLVLDLNAALYSKIAYVPKSTRVDSPIDDALESRQGVCQDFAHIMIGLARRIGIPCRYVSGYLFHKAGDKTRSAEGATHAWVEALLPGLGWVGLDPTNNVLASERHVRTAVGRDYADVPPTKGIFKGSADSQLLVAVQVLRRTLRRRLSPNSALATIGPPRCARIGRRGFGRSLSSSNNNSSSKYRAQHSAAYFVPCYAGGAVALASVRPVGSVVFEALSVLRP